jgi:hypothetical protein
MPSSYHNWSITVPRENIPLQYTNTRVNALQLVPVNTVKKLSDSGVDNGGTEPNLVVQIGFQNRFLQCIETGTNYSFTMYNYTTFYR